MLAAHLTKCCLTLVLRLKHLSHRKHQNCLYSECTSRWDFISASVQKRFGQWMQTYGFTALCLRTCALRLPLRPNFSQMWHVNQVPSLCDFNTQKMSLELDNSSKTLWTVSTWVRCCTSVNMNMTLQFIFCLKQLPTVRTVICFSVAVHMTFMWQQFLNGTSTHIRLFSAIHSFSAVHGMVDLHKRWI